MQNTYQNTKADLSIKEKARKGSQSAPKTKWSVGHDTSFRGSQHGSTRAWFGQPNGPQYDTSFKFRASQNGSRQGTPEMSDGHQSYQPRKQKKLESCWATAYKEYVEDRAEKKTRCQADKGASRSKRSVAAIDEVYRIQDQSVWTSLSTTNITRKSGKMEFGSHGRKIKKNRQFGNGG